MDNRYKAFIVTFFTVEFAHSFFDYVFFSDRNSPIVYFLLLPLFSALIFASIAGVIEPKIEKRFRGDDEKKEDIKRYLIIGASVIILAFLLSGFYSISSYEGVVLTKYSGIKETNEQVGIHYRIPGITHLERYDLRNNYLKYPDATTLSFSTRQGVVITAQVLVIYNIQDLNNFAIKSVNSQEQLTNLVQSSLNKNVQSGIFDLTNESFINLQESMIKEIRPDAEKIGINIQDVKINVAEPSDIINSKQSAEKTRVESEAKIIQAQNQKKSLEIEKESLKGFTPQQLDYLSKLELYNSLQNNPRAVYVIPQNSQININAVQ